MAQLNGAGFGQFLEADWVATDRRFIYVNFNAGSTSSWDWQDISRIAGRRAPACDASLTHSIGSARTSTFASARQGTQYLRPRRQVEPT
jgi:hypothetical protein